MDFWKKYWARRPKILNEYWREHFFSRDGSGFIQFRLKNVRASQSERIKLPRKMEPEKETNEAVADKADEVATGQQLQNIQEKIDWMKFSPPHRSNMAMHTQYFQDTHKYRRQLVMDCNNPVSITDMVTTFPRYQDIPHLIGIDFALLHEDAADKLLSKWSTLREKIILQGHQESESIKEVVKRYEDTNRDLCALLTVLYTLHRPLPKSKGVNCSRSAAVHYLVQHVPEGTSIKEAINHIKQTYRQPLIVAIGKETGQQQYFLCLDSLPFSAGQTIVEAFDKLFKSFFVFNVHYPDILSHFYDFFAAFVYEIWPTHKVKPMVRSFACSIKST
ncbi:uncharacterized protein LOC121419270 [Lytechinus variegatus]|uniref:uncharacterized protein LOC121419270 n=1 Tax=Lytechinus variegatus TaxID=7654 RepID=UPI001BB205EA|nr:uncharacterized protein LOC121419270 [Lytechinus variegatus]